MRKHLIILIAEFPPATKVAGFHSVNSMKVLYWNGNGLIIWRPCLAHIQTCQGLGINSQEYLEDIFKHLLDHHSAKLHELLPDQWLLNRQNPK